MINFDFNRDCCGCTACYNICPKGAIEMQPNNEGFLMPTVDIDKCIQCGLCDKVCPHLNTQTDIERFSIENFKEKEAYLYYSKSEKRKKSASGGFVYESMVKILNQGGVVCGCVWDENVEARHIVSDEIDDVYRMQSSKYVQSNLNNCYKDIRNALKNGRDVLFCGTPCQTAGLNRYLGKIDRSRLISICLICHGVPSPMVWNKWKDILEKKYQGKLLHVNMRDKSYKGYRTSYVSYDFQASSNLKNGACLHTSQNLIRNVGIPTFLSDPYIFLFTDDLFLRHSCNHCQYKAGNNGADIIVGDYYASTKGAGNMGCSCLISMTEKGKFFINNLPGSLIHSDYVTVASVNPMLWESVREHPRRKEFFMRCLANSQNDIRLFTDFLPLKFRIKKILNQLGLFLILRKIIKH